MTIAQEKGFYTRYLICTWPGGFADEFVVQGPLNGRYTVRRNALPGETAGVYILKSALYGDFTRSMERYLLESTLFRDFYKGTCA